MTEKEAEAEAEVGAEEDLAAADMAEEAVGEGGEMRIPSINLNRTTSSAHSSISSSSSISGSHRRGISGPRALMRAPIGDPLPQPRPRRRWAPLLLASGL